MDYLLAHEVEIRLGAFGALLALAMALEAVRPRRTSAMARPRRWLTNLTMAALGAAVVRLLALSAVPLTATATAAWAHHSGVGLLHALSLPVAAEIAIALAVLDLAVWLQHWATHRVPVLWRLHRVHHVDRDFDATTALRFHPLEIGLSMLWKCCVVVALGPSVASVIVFEIALNGLAVFNHANLHIPAALDRVLRLVLVTPDVHRVHHSTAPDEHNTNFGFSVTWWDRLFRTFRGAPRDTHEDMAIGLPGHQGGEPARLMWALGFPFRRSE